MRAERRRYGKGVKGGLAGALQKAAKTGNSKLIEELLSCGCNPNTSESFGMSPLHSACRVGAFDCVRLLVEAGADLDIAVFNRTALYWAALNESDLILDYLLEKGANLDKSVNDKGLTILHLAAEKGEYAICEKLLKRGAGAAIKNANGQTPLHVMLRMQRGISNAQKVDLIDLFMKYNADIHVDENDKTTLLVGMENATEIVALALLKKDGWDLTRRYKGLTPLLKSAQLGMPLLAAELVYRGANISELSDDGMDVFNILAKSKSKNFSAAFKTRMTTQLEFLILSREANEGGSKKQRRI